MFFDGFLSGEVVGFSCEIEVPHADTGRKVRNLLPCGGFESDDQIRPLRLRNTDLRDWTRLDELGTDSRNDVSGLLRPFRMGGRNQEQSQSALVGHG